MRPMQLVCLAAAAAIALAAPACAATVGLSGKIWKSPFSFGDVRSGTQIAGARNIIATTPVAVTFSATSLDYPNGDGAFLPSTATIASFLGRDAIGAAGNTAQSVAFTAFLFSGFINLREGSNEFRINADDGFVLDIDGLTIGQSEIANSNPVTPNTFFVQADRAGLKRFDLLYFDSQGGNAGLTAVLNGEVIDASMTQVDLDPVAPVPLPPAAAMMAAALVGLAMMRRRGTRAA